ncbi:hypothetical protein JCM10207_004332 [Rhodosporidiobolus poonsookiae]
MPTSGRKELKVRVKSLPRPHDALTLLLVQLASTTNEAPSPLSVLLKLPNELLDYIFELATVEHPLRGPLCKPLLPFYYRHQWSRFTIRSPAQLNEAAKRAEQEQGFKWSVKWLSISLKGTRWHEKDKRRDAVGDFLVKLPALVTLKITESDFLVDFALDLEYVSKLPMLRCYEVDCEWLPPSRAAKMVLTLLRKGCFAAAWFWNNSLPGPRLDGLTSLTLQRLSSRDGLVVHFLRSLYDLQRLSLIDVKVGRTLSDALDALPRPDRLTALEIDGAAGANIDLRTFADQLRRFSRLIHLELSGSIVLSQPLLLNTLRSLPLVHLTFGTDLPISKTLVEPLLSDSSILQSLKRLTLSTIWGRRGPSAEECYYDPWAFEEEWTAPTFDQSLTRAALSKLISLAQKTGLEVDGDSLEALDIEYDYLAEREEIANYLRQTGDKRGKGWLSSDDEYEP